MTKSLKNWLSRKESTLTERALKRFSQHKPVSKIAKGMFANETSETLNERFAKARKQLSEVV